MKTKTLSLAALTGLKATMTSKPTSEPETPTVVVEETLTNKPIVEPVVKPVVETTTDESLAELTDLKEKFSAIETENISLTETIAGLEAQAESSKAAFTASEELVTNLSTNLLGVVNSMKVAMGHVELGEEVAGAALLKEYTHTLPKYLESIPSGSAVDEPTAIPEDNTTQSLSAAADIKNYAW